MAVLDLDQFPAVAATVAVEVADLVHFVLEVAFVLDLDQFPAVAATVAVEVADLVHFVLEVAFVLTMKVACMRKSST